MKRIITVILTLCLAMALAQPSAFAEKKQKKVEEVTFLTYLHCENCKKKVQENIAFEKGVKSLEVSLEKQTIKIGYDPGKTDTEKLAKAIGKLGYKAEIKDGAEEHEHNHKQ